MRVFACFVLWSRFFIITFVARRVVKALADLNKDFGQWQHLLASTNTYLDPTFTPLTRKIKMNAKLIVADVGDLEQTVKIVEANRERFKGISFWFV